VFDLLRDARRRGSSTR